MQLPKQWRLQKDISSIQGDSVPTSKTVYSLPTGILLLCAILLIAGCATPYGVYHTVERGQTLWRIARTYDISLQEIAEINNIKDPSKIKAGQSLFIPGVASVREVKPYVSERVEEGEPQKNDIVLEKDRFIWPVKGKILVEYGIKDGQKQNGIEIEAPLGTPILAADEGEVVYSDNKIKGYGNVIIIKHRDGFYTTYAYNRENLVKTGEMVKKGDIIATVGYSLIAKNYILHFEVREGKRPRNPLFFLP